MARKNQENNGEIELHIYSISTSITESIIFLDEVEGMRILPIWIGPIEAQSIAIRLSGFPSPRPMTHDLIFSLLKTLKYNMTKAVINDVKDNTYYALLHLADGQGKTIHEIDARPSDAIAMAVRFGCPIYVKESVLATTQVLNKPITESEVLKFREELKTLTPKDIIDQLLKHKMDRPPLFEEKEKKDKKEEDEDPEETNE
ncbi:MAG: bifunctional nuclease family protein [Elusimicrobia bacterium]|nr:bifunctional nuclease family protein [Elusimicrobiota bacterium]